MKDKFRLFEAILYIDSISYDIKEVLKCIRGERYYAYTLHDQDLDEEGHIKKPHYHIVIRFDNARTKSGVAKKLGIPENFVNNIRNERTYIRYLIHFDDKEKYQYRQSDIVCSRSYERFVNKCFDDKETEDEILENIFCKINELISNNFSYHDTIIHLVKYININAYETIYKRYRNEIKDYILTVK